MRRRTAVITGATGGLGLVSARHLAAAGMDVVFIGRDAGRTAAAAESLRDLSPAGHAGRAARWYVADLSQWSQVRDLATTLADTEHGIDVLINNAGVALPRYGETTDLVERTYAVNHHAPFLLTHLLLEAGALTESARIVNVSSFVEKRGKLDPVVPDVAGTSWRDRHYSQIHVYATSKLLSLLAARELAWRLPEGMSIYNADPGMVKHTDFNSSAGGLMRLTAPLFKPFATTPENGVQTLVWLASTHPAPEPTGGFFSDNRPAVPSRLAQNAALARAVYERTASLLDIATRAPTPAKRP